MATGITESFSQPHSVVEAHLAVSDTGPIMFANVWTQTNDVAELLEITVTELQDVCQ